ncbi:heparinase II/III domain-containing protein [Daejeonella lutea]|uniref:Heparinase II/III-like protein n=1 Tax=Daejeonella lutea TaxID=572036 RepID=A0A1T5A6S2_9SPHI|nr:heparinase II/III family protein [Daejeonella lutea]SKB30585.1 Heparinase II/III-like protein [Daejeonella lutea]
MILRRFVFLLILALLGFNYQSYSQRSHGGFYTKEKLSNVQANCNKYDWGKKLKSDAISKAAFWTDKSDEELWAMVQGQNLPRTIDVTFDRLTKGPKILGCLKCGLDVLKYGNYPYEPEFEKKPWKLTCPSCKSVFPTNDFAKFFKSAIDETGQFNASKGDKSLLFNAEHPDPNDPLHKYGVDDGFGYIDSNGRSHKFIAYYNWKHWDYINKALNELGDAYIYTGNKLYARKAAIILDRLADVYPAMDWNPYAARGWYGSDGGTLIGKIGGNIWETSLVRIFVDNYDKIISGTLDNPELYSFLKKQSQKYKLPSPKGSRSLFIKNVDDGLLREVYNGALSKKVKGNQGMHQLAVAMAAMALDTQPETTTWLDWVFAPNGGDISGQMINNLDHDGTTEEGAPGYTFMWGRLVTDIADRLDGYAGYTKHNIIKEFPQYATTFLAAYRMSALGKALPNIGDAGSTGYVGNYIDPKFITKGYRYTKDPEYAKAAFRSNKFSAEGLERDIFAKDPDIIAKEIAKIGSSAGPRPIGGYLMSGFGLAILEGGKGASEIALTSNYGRTMKHAHPDMLNFDLFAFGNWLAPDHGYPEYATPMPSNHDWTGSTISHNTVFVDEKPQKEIWSGYSKIFKQLNGFGVFELDGKKAYPGLDTYKRTMFLIEAGADSNSYVIDLFQVNGGNDHVYSFHGPPGEITTSGLNLIPQKEGTYAGENIPKGTGVNGFPRGYSFFYNVKKDLNPAGQFMIDWKAEPGYRTIKAEDNVHLRMYSLTQSKDVALADGDPPQNKPGNPKKLGYVLMHTEGDKLKSNFVSVIEPYKHKPFIKSVKRLATSSEDQIALQIEHTNGETDYVMYNAGTQEMQLPNNLSMSGTIGYIRTNSGSTKKAVLINGTSLSDGKVNLKSEGQITGKVVNMNRETSGGGWIVVDQKLPEGTALKGEQIFVTTDGERDASYTIVSIETHGNSSKIYCGPISFVSGLKPLAERTEGSNNYRFDFEPGAKFTITSHSEWPLIKK